MIKKTITYTDYNGLERTEDFYFNLTKAELLSMEWGTVGGLSENIKTIVNAKDTQTIVEIFEKLLQKSYGKKSADGRRFIKNQEVLDDFMQTEAYSQLYIELATDADKAADFINKIIPSDLATEVANNQNTENLFPLPQEVTK